MPLTHDLPRERLIALGPTALSDAELVAIHLGTGRTGEPVLTLAGSLLDEWGGVAGLARAGVDELARRPGIGPAKAARLVAAFGLAARVAPQTGAVVRTSADVARLAQARIGAARAEEVLLVTLDGGHRVRRVDLLARGTATSCPMPVREILAAVLRHDGVAFAVAHNHPGGDPTPTAADVAATETLRGAAQQVRLRFLDHVVVSAHDWRSVSAWR